MGQQQLLLLVLGIVIVGLAIVVGIQAFSENKKKANADALVMDVIRIASDAQAWKLKPAAFGGGASVTGFTGVTFEQLGYPTTAGVYENLNGSFNLTSGANLTITGQSTAVASGGGDNNCVLVVVSGTSPNDIATQVNPASGCP